MYDKNDNVDTKVIERAIIMCEGKSGHHIALKDRLQQRLIKRLKQEKHGYSIIEGVIRQNLDIKLKGKNEVE